MRLFRNDNFLYEKRRGDLTVQVLQRNERRELRFGNHITQSAVSTTDPGALQLDYTRAMMAGFLFAPKAEKILHIGLGGGSLPRFIHQHLPNACQTVVELSEEVIEVAYRYFFLPVSPRLEVFQGEGEAFLGESGEKFELIFLDEYLADGVPGNLNALPFLKQASSHLTGQGWLIDNVWGSDHKNLELVRRNLRSVFPGLCSVSVRWDSNFIFFAHATAELPTAETLFAAAEARSLTFPLNLETTAREIKPVPGGGAGGLAER